MSKPDPEDFTGNKPYNKDEKPGKVHKGYNSIVRTGNKVKNKFYESLGIENESGEINERRRNLITVLGAGTGAGVIGYTAAKELEGIENLQEDITDSLSPCNQGYEIKEEIIKEADLYQVGVMEPNSQTTTQHGKTLKTNG